MSTSDKIRETKYETTIKEKLRDRKYDQDIPRKPFFASKRNRIFTVSLVPLAIYLMIAFVGLWFYSGAAVAMFQILSILGIITGFPIIIWMLICLFGWVHSGEWDWTI